MTTPESNRSVPFFNYPHVFESHREELISTFENVASRGAYILQQEMEDFEKHLAEYTGVKFALGVANGTDALLIALRAAGVGPGDEVIFCSHTYVATAAAIHFVGAVPRPIECGSDHMMDVCKIEDAVTERTKAIMPTQLNGRTCDMDAIQEIADRHQLLIVEDAAQALGSKYKGKHAGTFGVAGTISFYPAKTLGSLGDAGAILTNDDRMCEAMSQMRDHGRNADGDVVSWGLNSRLDNLQAAILDVKLRDYAADVDRRREIACMYHEQLQGISQLTLPPAPGSEPDHFDVFQNYEIEADSRDELQTRLKSNGVGTLVQWGGKVVHQFEGLQIKGKLPFTERMISRSLMLPLNTSLTDDDVRYVCDNIADFYAQQTTAGESQAA